MHFFSLPAVFVGGEIVDMISNTGAVAKLVLLALLAFSLISWAIILTKWSLLRRARTQSGRFVRAFRKAQRLQDIAAVADQFKPSPLVAVFDGGYEEYRRQVATSGGLRNPISIQRGMQIGASEGITRLERNVPWYRSHRDLHSSPYCRIELYDRLTDIPSCFAPLVRSAETAVPTRAAAVAA